MQSSKQSFSELYRHLLSNLYYLQTFLSSFQDTYYFVITTKRHIMRLVSNFCSYNFTNRILSFGFILQSRSVLHTKNRFSPQYTVIDDAAVEDTEEFSVTFKGVEPHVEPDVESAEFLLIIEDNDSMGHFGILCDYFKLFVTPNTHNGNLVFLFL